ncbi:MAG: DUF835 domain-containing protein [Methanomassiliicoccales archaeon]|jgi:hypothetical protein
MQIDVKPGLLYFLKGKEDVRVRELVATLRSAGYRLLVVTSRASVAVSNDLETPPDCILTLTESEGQYCVDPQNLMVLTDTITKFIERDGPSAFLIEDLGLLKQKNEFPRVLRLVGFLYESLAMSRGIGIIVIDPQSWDDREMAHLGKEGCIMEEKDRLDVRSLQPRNR